MEEQVNKYPIVLGQILTGRESCPHCDRTQRGIAKCDCCGFFSKDEANGFLMAAYEKTKKPMLLIENVTCELIKCKIAEDPEKYREMGYHTHDGEIYHLINILDFKVCSVSNGCYKCRKDESCGLDDLCIWQDLHYAKKVFSAVRNNIEIFEPYDEGAAHFSYFSYVCAMSGLTETIIPIYAVDDAHDRKQRGLVGLLFIGQNKVGPHPQHGNIISNDWTSNPAVQTRTQEVIHSIPVLRNEMWNGGGLYASAHDALTPFADDIMESLTQLQGEVIARETGFLFSYQTKLVNEFLAYDSSYYGYRNEAQQAEHLRSRIVRMFQNIWRDFSLKQLIIFIPDIELKETMRQTAIQGISVNPDHSTQPPIIHFTKLTKQSHYDLKNDLIIPNVITLSEPLVPEKLEQGLYEFYAILHGEEASKTKKKDTPGSRKGRTMFGILLEWESRPFDYNDNNDHHGDFFRTLVGICSSEIMAMLASLRETRLLDFTEEVQHDMAHRLQALQSHNISFGKNSNKFYIHESIDKQSYRDVTDAYLQANERLHDSFGYVMKQFNSVNVYLKPEPQNVNIGDILGFLNHHYNAPWHPRNNGQVLLVPRDDAYAWIDKDMLEHILTNLIDNAVKYAPPHTNVHVTQRYSRDSKFIVLNIISFGYGISEELAKDMFERGKKGRSASAGKGLGLHIAKDYTERNDGTLELKSGMIPASGDTEEKRSNGLISDLNFTMYDKVCQYNGDHPNDSAGIALEDKIAQKIKEMETKQSLFGLGERILLNAVMVDKSKRHISQDEPLGLRELTFHTNKDIYLVAFQLSVPTKEKEDKS